MRTDDDPVDEDGRKAPLMVAFHMTEVMVDISLVSFL